LSSAVRVQHTYIVGQTGTGKSTLMLNMIVSDLAAGHGLTVLDPHGALVAAVLERVAPERIDDVILLDPADPERQVGLNVLDVRTEDPEQYLARRDALVDELFDTFDALYDMRVAGGPMFEQYFRGFLALVMGSTPPQDYSPRLPMIVEAMNNARLVRALAGRLSDADAPLIATLEAMLDAGGETTLQNMTPYIVSKLNRFIAPAVSRRILCQARGLDFSDILRSNKILLVDLPSAKLGPGTAALIARQVIAQLANAAMRRGGVACNLAHYVYADEFHHFATERFASLLAEARKFGLGLILAHQYTSQLTNQGSRKILDAVLGNVGTVAAFRVGAQDAELLDAVMAPRASAADIAGLPNHVAVVRSVGELGNVPFTLRTRPPQPVASSLASEVRQRSRARYGVPVREIDEEIKNQLQSFRAVS
jgi:type IV secretory pathway TraG/TraD family ATPase VirD4